MKLIISDYNRKKITEILKIYREIRKASEVFEKENHVFCPEGCGFCCNSTEVDGTILGALPLAHFLLKISDNKTINSILEKLNDLDERSPCFFFRKDSDIDWKGRCSVYKYRLLVCRLFGFYRRKDKHGKYITGTCRILKNNYHSFDSKNCIAPGIADFSTRFTSIGSDSETKLIPINLAIKNAIEYLQFDMMKEALKRQ
ncbi:MAG TPA: hypothetical protein DD381_00345 [Lentisphaeria bacterium]|nr:MAG: hypothetical protein A2X47_06070 [Lentisphaerae bacterium GWF2_38_69]HBM14791.1 hypothetical protein [Lentisphaeria bacterium]